MEESQQADQSRVKTPWVLRIIWWVQGEKEERRRIGPQSPIAKAQDLLGHAKDTRAPRIPSTKLNEHFFSLKLILFLFV
jgi:hypothetical protein